MSNTIILVNYVAICNRFQNFLFNKRDYDKFLKEQCLVGVDVCCHFRQQNIFRESARGCLLYPLTSSMYPTNLHFYALTFSFPLFRCTYLHSQKVQSDQALVVSLSISLVCLTTQQRSEDIG